MSDPIKKLAEFVIAEFIDPSQHNNENLESIIKSLENEPRAHARAIVVKRALYGDCTDAEKNGALSTYADSAKDGEAASLIEAARAAAAFEESDLSSSYIEKAETSINFQPEIAGVEVKLGPHQTKPTRRLSCLVKSTNGGTDSPSSTSIENVGLQNSTDERFAAAQYISERDADSSTSPLTNTECTLSLLRAVHHSQTNASAKAVVNEQVLPYIRRITESSNLGKLELDIQKQALFYRSISEMNDIEELERGAVQLSKISMANQNQSEDVRSASLRHFHKLPVLSWRTVDENAARRLVAMSDFGNAIPIYRRLGMKFDLAVSLAAVEKVDEALEVLETITPMTGQASMLMADLSADAKSWTQAWDEFNEPKAKLRLAAVASSENDANTALQHSNESLVKAPTNYDALLLASRASSSSHKWEEASGYLKRASAINDDDAGNWSNLATAFVQSNQPEPAHHASKQAIRVNQNAEPNSPTLSNYISLSAQLNKWDEAVVGLIKLCDAIDKGAITYIAKISSIFPRLVNFYIKQPYTGEGMQKFVVHLFTVKSASVIANDDPMSLRLSAQIFIWSQNYAAGLKSYVDASDALLKSGVDFKTDARSRARLQSYAKDATEALTKHGDSPGRIEGSTAFPGWKSKVLEIENSVKKADSGSG